MGCDIHICTEVLTHVNDIQAWRSADHFKLNQYFGADEDEAEYCTVDVYNGRNYELFFILAGVRPRLDDAKSMGVARGIPDDCCSTTRTRSDEYGADGHSHSNHTLAELYAFINDNQPPKHSGLVSPECAARLDAGEGFPASWCQGSSDKSLVYREWVPDRHIMANFMEAIEARAKEEFWIFGDGPVPTDKAEKFRIVFWFDN